ncbi:MAG: hypothetical protein HY866_06955 [Chloroflexi bacterium]|nr:hypothetical protein [Chloroflexota bacterium]
MLVLLLTAVVPASSVHAITVGDVTLGIQTVGKTCEETYFSVSVWSEHNADDVLDDGPYWTDFWGFILYDGDHSPILAYAGSSIGISQAFQVSSVYLINPVDAWPITVEIYDTTTDLAGATTADTYNNVAAAGVPVLKSLSFSGEAEGNPCVTSDDVIESVGSVPGCDTRLPLTADAVVGTFVSDTKLYWGASMISATDATVPTISAGKTAWVLGMDKSGSFYRIIWQCQSLWVPVNTMGPNNDNVWHGKALPTNVVS